MLSQKLTDRIYQLSSTQKGLLAEKAKNFLKEQSSIIPLDNQLKVTGVGLTSSQQRLFRQAATADGFAANVVFQKVSFKGKLEGKTFIKTLLLVLERHGVSKTVFKQQDDQILQYQQVSFSIDVPYIDLKEESKSINDIETGLSNHKFEINNEPMFKAALVKISSDEHVFYFITHNLIFDAWSFSLLMTELKQFYNAAVGAKENIPARPGIDYFDFVVWQHHWKNSKRYQDQLASWRKRLIPHGDDIKLEFPRTTTYGFHGKRIAFDLPIALKNKLIAIGKQQGATLFMVMSASIQFFLAKTMEMRQVCIGTINANRTRKDIEDVMGYFLNIIPISVNIDAKNDKFSDVITRTKEDVLHGIKNSDVYYEDLINTEEQHFDAGRNPYFDVLFSFENVALDKERFIDVTEDYQDIDKGTARYDLTISIYDEEQSFKGWFEYNTALFSPATVEKMISNFVSFIELIAHHPHQSLAKLEL